MWRSFWHQNISYRAKISVSIGSRSILTMTSLVIAGASTNLVKKDYLARAWIKRIG